MRRLFPKHNWQMIGKAEMQSAWDQMGEVVRNKASVESKIPRWVFCKRVLVLMSCEHCGKLKTITERNP